MFTPNTPPRTQPQPGHRYDVAVVGAGLAGTELAWRLARAGRDVLLVSQALDTLGNLYQPSVAGADFAPDSLFEQVRAAIAPETDGWAFHRHLKASVEGTAGIHLLQSCVTALDEEETQVQISTWEGPTLHARQVVLAVGAFLKGRLLIGDTLEEAGRLSEVAYDFLSDDLAAHGLYLNYGSQQAETDGNSGNGSTSGYEVRFQVLDAGLLDGFAVKRLDHTYALGRCTAGNHTYRSVLEDAAQLAELLIEGKA